MSDKELIWVDKEQAELFKNLSTDDCKKEFIDKLIEKRKIDMKSDLDCLDDDLVRFKAFGITYKQELEKIYTDQNNLLDQIWVEHEEKINGIRSKIEQLTPKLHSVKSEVSSLNEGLSKIPTYAFDKLFEAVHKVNSMSQEDKKLLTDLIKLTNR